MKIRVLRNLGNGLPPYLEGQVVDADKETAARLIEAGLAEPVERPKAVTPAPERLEAVTPVPDRLEAVPPDAVPPGAAAEVGRRKKK